MSLSVEEIKVEILMLPEQELLKLIDFIEGLKINLTKRKFRELGLFKGQIKMADDFNLSLL
jgi:hypothetical protein